MQLLDLRPGPLTVHQTGPSPSTHTIEYDDFHAALMSGPLLARLSKLEYALIMAVLRRRHHWQNQVGQSSLVVSVADLCKISRSQSEQSVHRHMNSAARKVEALGIRVYRLRSENVYLVLFAPEALPGSTNDPTAGDQLMVIA